MESTAVRGNVMGEQNSGIAIVLFISGWFVVCRNGFSCEYVSRLTVCVLCVRSHIPWSVSSLILANLHNYEAMIVPPECAFLHQLIGGLVWTVFVLAAYPAIYVALSCFKQGYAGVTNVLHLPEQAFI